MESLDLFGVGDSPAHEEDEEEEGECIDDDDKFVLGQRAAPAAQPRGSLRDAPAGGKKRKTRKQDPEVVVASTGPKDDSEADEVEEDDDGPDVNVEMQKLLRAPRYFDQDFELAAIRCFNCGGSGHMAHSCTQPRKRRPCFLCGGLGHERADCPNGLCFKCRKPGHHMRDCKASSADVHKARARHTQACLRCGRPGHSMAACTRDYQSSDLALAQCFVCFKLGHLCCGSRPSIATKESCYNCGKAGHLGPNCPHPVKMCPGAAYEAHVERTERPPMECFRCGGEHMKRDCTATYQEAMAYSQRNQPVQQTQQFMGLQEASFGQFSQSYQQQTRAVQYMTYGNMQQGFAAQGGNAYGNYYISTQQQSHQQQLGGSYRGSRYQYGYQQERSSGGRYHDRYSSQYGNSQQSRQPDRRRR